MKRSGITVSDGRVTRTFTAAEWAAVRSALANVLAGEQDDEDDESSGAEFQRAYDKATAIGNTEKK